MINGTVFVLEFKVGMALFVPRGDPNDATRSPEFYDGTYQYLRDLGIPELAN